MTPEAIDGAHSRLTRREFLRLTAILFAGITTSIAILDVNGRRPAVDLPQESLSPELASQLDCIRTYYGLEVYTDLSSLQRILGREAKIIPDEDLYPIIVLIRQGLSVYPPEYFRRNSITGITLVAELRSLEKKFDGEAVYLDRDVIINVTGSRELILLALYHELFHRTDFGSASAPKIGALIRTTLQWEELYQTQVNSLNDDLMRWYFEYGLSGGIEDRAVHGAVLLMPALHARLLLRCANETDLMRRVVIEEKIRQVKQLYCEWSGGKMNDQYWEDLLAGKVSERYFSSSPMEKQIHRV